MPPKEFSQLTRPEATGTPRTDTTSNQQSDFSRLLLQQKDQPSAGSSAEFPNSIERTFSSLRYDTHRKMISEVEARKNLKPEKTKEETEIGIFIEEIEPQVRDAVLELNRKGYETRSSGFNGEKSDYQAIGGYFTLDDETVKELKKINVGIAVHKGWHNYMEQIVDKSQPGSDTHPISKEQEEEITKQAGDLIQQNKIEQMMELTRQNANRYEHWKGSTLIYFKPSKPNLETMKSEWARITSLIKERVTE
jgi:hypothetical protein